MTHTTSQDAHSTTSQRTNNSSKNSKARPSNRSNATHTSRTPAKNSEPTSERSTGHSGSLAGSVEKNSSEPASTTPHSRIHNALLSLSPAAPKERSPTTPLLYTRILQEFPDITHVLDLGGGMNLFAYPYLGRNLAYSIHELSSIDANFLSRYLRARNITGEATSGDLTHSAPPTTADTLFIFKLLDTLEAQKRGSAIQLLETYPHTNRIVSFPTKSLGTKTPIPLHIRKWFLEWVRHHPHTEVTLPNETFFLIHSDTHSPHPSRASPLSHNKQQ
ncbi:MAG: hypothetical protein HC945_01655 [Nitrosarchaeum sp.]|nr:hypothetical protein [Nitrosarchaeum sp.]